MVNSPKTILVIQPSTFQGEVWSSALMSQGLSVVWKAANVNIPEFFLQLEASKQPLPDVLLMEVGTQTISTPFGICRWCSDRYPEMLIILVNSTQSEIASFEKKWATVQGARDLLPGFQINTLMDGAIANINAVLQILGSPPYQERALIRALLPILQNITPHSTQALSTSVATTAKTIRFPQWAIVSKLMRRREIKLGLVVIGSLIAAYGLFQLSPNLSTQPAAIAPKDISLSATHTLNSHTGAVFAIAVSADGQSFFSGSGDRLIKQWNLKTGELLQTFSGHQKPVVSLAISPDQKTLVSGSRDRTVRVWDIDKDQLKQTLSAGNAWLQAVTISPDGHLLVGASENKQIIVWDFKTLSFQRKLIGHTEDLEAIAVSPDSRILVSSAGDNTIKLWNIGTGKLLRTLTGHTSEPEAMILSPDGKNIFSGDTERIREWDFQTGKLQRLFPENSGLIRTLAISSDGKLLASGHTDNTIKLWDLATGKRLRLLVGHSDWVLSVAFTPDNKTLISGSRDKTIKFWSLKTLEGQK